MAEALLPLATLGVAAHLATLKGLQSQANAYSKMGAPGLPGIPDIKAMAKAMLEAEVEKILEEVRVEIMALLLGIMTGILIGMIPELNKIIRVLNKIINAIDAFINAMIPVATTVFVVIIGLVIIKTISAFLMKIPPPTIGMMVGIALNLTQSIATLFHSAADFLLPTFQLIAYIIIATLLLLLSIFAFLLMIMGIISMFTQQQADASSEAVADFSATADDWANSTDVIGTPLGEGDNVPLVECTLPSGEVRMMTAEACLAAGGTFPGMELLSELNEINLKLRECTTTDSNTEECIGLRLEYNDLIHQLGDLSEFQLDTNIITSLLNPHNNATIKKATLYGSKRYGFYGAESGISKQEEDPMYMEDVEIPITDDLLNTLNDTIENMKEESDKNMKAVEDAVISTKSLPEPIYFEDYDLDNDGIFTVNDVTIWNDIGRPDIAAKITNWIDKPNLLDYPQHNLGE